MEIYYLITPFVTWIITGCLKFIWNSLTHRRLAFDLIGYGGMPSNHSAIVSSMAALIGFREGIDHPAFGVALTLSFIVVLDAYNLRRQIGVHAETLNEIKPGRNLRTRIGHSKSEILAGILVGIVTGRLIFIFVLNSN